MVTLVSLRWNGRVWEALVDVRHGVVRRPRYPVTVTYLGPVSDPERRADLAEVVVALVRRHLHQGSLPPGGLLVNLRQVYAYVVQYRHTARWSPADIVRLRRLLEQTLPVTRGDGHGYYHPLQPVAAPQAEARAAEARGGVA
jgi:hypothetical protein